MKIFLKLLLSFCLIIFTVFILFLFRGIIGFVSGIISVF